MGGTGGGREGQAHRQEEGPAGQGRYHMHDILATEAGLLITWRSIMDRKEGRIVNLF